MVLVSFKVHDYTGKCLNDEHTLDTRRLTMYILNFEAISPTALIEIQSLLAFVVPAFLVVLVLQQYWALSDVPGPFLAAFTRLWHARTIKNGTHARDISALHRRLGHFVRIAPDEVSVAHPDGPRKLLLEALSKVGISLNMD